MTQFSKPIAGIAVAVSVLNSCLVAADVSASVHNATIGAQSLVKYQPPYCQPVASRESEQIQTRVVVTKRRRRGNMIDANFRIEFDAVPQGKQYQQCFWDMGMRRDGQNPSCLSQTVQPDRNDKIIAYFELDSFVQGEWIQLTIRSTDGKVQKSVRFTPFK